MPREQNNLNALLFTGICRRIYKGSTFIAPQELELLAVWQRDVLATLITHPPRIPVFFECAVSQPKENVSND